MSAQQELDSVSCTWIHSNTSWISLIAAERKLGYRQFFSIPNFHCDRWKNAYARFLEQNLDRSDRQCCILLTRKQLCMTAANTKSPPMVAFVLYCPILELFNDTVSTGLYKSNEMRKWSIIVNAYGFWKKLLWSTWGRCHLYWAGQQLIKPRQTCVRTAGSQPKIRSEYLPIQDHNVAATLLGVWTRSTDVRLCCLLLCILPSVTHVKHKKILCMKFYWLFMPLLQTGVRVVQPACCDLPPIFSALDDINRCRSIRNWLIRVQPNNSVKSQ
jgi:hypothetical protein